MAALIRALAARLLAADSHKNKIEVDIVLEDRRGTVVGIEVKAASTVRTEDLRGLRHLDRRLGDDFRAGIVLYTGTETLPFGHELPAIPVSAVWEAAPGFEP
ncbi:hypothetical protein [Nocardia sp. NPDC058497]|uniref:hypothetical protein n=1 Tax=Nocardia sp. NPDC058497 TaxID=3346529 RepID=UPI00365A8D46